jgi:3-oxoacyl-[acyl-carrier-protein] synthase-3
MNQADIHILAVGTELPGPLIDNATLIRRFGLPQAWEEWIDIFVGTKSRHFAIDIESGERKQTLTDMGTLAGRRALEKAGVDPGSIDVAVMGAAMPDMLMPATVNLIADRLGINDLPTYQLQAGCTGAIQALDLAIQLLRSGQYRTALVLGGDSIAKHLDLDIDPNDTSAGLHVNAMLFGDGAGAAVLTTDPVPGTPVLRQAFVRMLGLGRPPGQIVEWFGLADLKKTHEPVSEDFKVIEESVPAMAVAAFQDLLDFLDWKKSEVDFLLPPQLSAKMTARVVEQLDARTASVISRVEEIGNTTNAIPFFQLEQLIPRLLPGNRAIGISVETSKWIKGGYAVEMPSTDKESK